MNVGSALDVLRKPWVLGLLAALFLTGPWFWPVEEIVVRADLPYVHVRSVERALAQHLAWGMWWSDLDQSAKALRQFPWVAQTQIKRHYPNRWEVFLRPPPIVARWHQGGIINAEGERITLHPMPKGFDQKPLWVAEPVFLPKMVLFMRDMEAALAHFPLELHQVRFSPLSGWVLVFSDHVTVRLPLRADASYFFSRFLIHIDQLGGMASLRGKAIDLRYSHGVSLV